MAEPARQFDDDNLPGNADSAPPGRVELEVLEGGGETTSPNKSWYKPEGSQKSASREELSQMESSGEQNAQNSNEYETSQHENQIGGGYKKGSSKENSTIWRKLFVTNRRKTLAGGGVVGAIVAIFFGLSVFQGPFQFIHIAQLMQQFHFRSNEDFGDDRGGKILLYALAGKGTERGRLGVVGNSAADKWEERLIKNTGLRPIYTTPSGRFAGYEIVDHDKAKSTIEDWKHTGGEVRKVGDSDRTGQQVVGSNKDRAERRLNPRSDFIDARADKPAARRALIRSVSKSTKTYKIASAVGSRLLIKRGGVDFHPLKNIKRKTGEKLVEYKKRVRDNKAERDRKGNTAGKLGDDDRRDKDGNRVATQADIEATGEAQAAIEEAQANPGRENLQNILNRIGKGAALVGIFCAVKSFGDNVEEYKYTNNYLPEMRMGMSAISMGNQVMNGNDASTDELGAYNESFYDSKSKTSWTEARSIQAEQGQKQTGPDVPSEAKLNNINNQPFLFDVINSIPFLGKGCGLVSGAINSIPVLNKVAEIGSDAILAGLNEGAKLAGTSVDELSEAALAAVSGQSVNTLAKGAEYGNLVNVGSFIAANDQAISMGGTPLEPSEVAQLKTEDKIAEREEEQSKSFVQRYLDPKNINSVTGRMSFSAPHSFSELFSIFSNPLKTFGNVLSSLAPKAQAANSKPYDYGVPKYGFSLAEQENSTFEDPYENAVIVEDEAHGGALLDSLNEKYGNKCFGITVEPSSSGVSIESGDAVNVFEVSKEDDCNPKKNKDPLFLRYRFYIADAISANSLACYEGSDDACSQVGVASDGSDSSSQASNTPVSGNAKELAKELVTSRKVSGDGRYMNQLEQAAKGNFDCNVNPTILKLLVGLVHKGHSFFISSLNRYCTGVLTDSGPASYHYADGGGHAVDLSVIDGTSATGGNPKDIALIKDAFEFMPSGSGVGQSGCRPAGTLKLPNGIREFPDTCNHVHLQVPKEQAR